MTGAHVRSATADDAASLADIYNHFIATSTITFEEEPVTPAEMAQRLAHVAAIPLPWLVATLEGAVAGFAYAHKWKPRAAYRHSVEITVYVRDGHGGRGIGSLLYERLIGDLRTRGVHAVIGGVALPNDASLRLHRKFGFEQVAHFRGVGFKFDRWIDVTYWELIL